MIGDTYRAVPAASLEIRGDVIARRHFRQEYASALDPRPVGPPAAAVDVRFGRAVGVATGGHKTVRWAVVVGDPNGDALEVAITLSGRPRRFALSLVQGFVVEPLASIAAARVGHVLLPAAALADGDGATLLLGRSGTGKTSVVARAVAAGRPALGDDQVVVGGDGAVRPWPRRLRVYPDLRHTAPGAVRALPRRKRRALAALGLLRAASGGWAAPSLPLRWEDLAGERPAGALPARRLVIIERRGARPALTATQVATSEAVDLARAILREERERFAAVAGSAWNPALAATEEREAGILAAALRDVPAERWVLPEVWTAARAVDTLAIRLGV